MPIWLKATRSYNNPESVNYRIAYLREQMSKNLGFYSYAEQVQMAMLGKTIVVGGYINTELLRAKSIIAEMLNVEDLAAITGKFSGDVYVGGDLLVGGQGVLSAFIFESSGTGAFGDTGGWSALGLVDSAGTISKGNVTLRVSIPDNFLITKATLYLYTMPTFYENPMPVTGHATKWKQSRNLKLYYNAAAEEAYWLYVESSGMSIVNQRSGVDISSAAWGASNYSPALPYSGTSEANTQNKVEVKEANIINYLEAGKVASFYVMTNDAENPSNFENNQGLGKLVAVIQGYARPSS